MNPFPRLAAALLGAAVVVGVLFIGQSFLETRRLFLVAAPALTVLIVISVMTASRRGPTVFFDAKVFGLAGIFTFLVVGMLKSVFIYDAPVTTDVATALKAILVVVISVAGFLLGSARPFRPLRLGRLSRSRLSTPRLLTLTLVLGTAGLVSLLAFNNPARQFDESVSKFTQLLSGFLPVAGALALWLLFLVRPRTPARRLFFRLVLLPWPVLAIFSTSRQPLAFIMSFAFLLYVYRLWTRGPKPFPVGRVVVLAVVVAVGLLFTAAVVDILVELRWHVEGSPSAVLEWAAASSEEFSSVDAFDNLVAIVELYPNRGHYLYGWSVLGVIVNPIPRSVWPEKPYGFARLLVEELGLAMIRGHSMAPSLAGEMLANFGYLGPFLGYLLLGLITASLYQRFLQASPDSPFHALYLASLMMVLLESRGDLLSITIRMGWYLVMMYVALRLSAVGAREVTLARGPAWTPAPAIR